MSDPVNRPAHYLQHPRGIECIDVVEHMPLCRGAAIQYIWRAGLKGGPEQELEDLKKSRWYIDREIARLERGDR